MKELLLPSTVCNAIYLTGSHQCVFPHNLFFRSACICFTRSFKKQLGVRRTTRVTFATACNDTSHICYSMQRFAQ